MISSLEIYNFQSIKYAKIDFGKMTVITGDSDVGKSAIIRALRALILNRVSAQYSHKGKGPIEITVVTDRGKVSIAREEGKSAVYYVNGEKYSNIGRQVPKEVVDILAIREYQIDKDITIMPALMRQLDPQFLLQQGSAVISKTIGRISNISIVFAAIRKASADVVALQAETATEQTKLDIVKRDLDEFADLDARERVANALKVALENAKTSSLKLEEAKALVKSLEGIDSEKHTLFLKFKALETLLGELAATEAGLTAVLQFYAIRAQSEKVVAESVPTKAKIEALPTLIQALDDVLQRATVLAEGVYTHNQSEKAREEHNSVRALAESKIEAVKQIDSRIKALVESAPICPLIEQGFKDGCREQILARRIL